MKLRGYRQHRATGEVWAVESEDNVDVGCVGPISERDADARLLDFFAYQSMGLFPYRVQDFVRLDLCPICSLAILGTAPVERLNGNMAHASCMAERPTSRTKSVMLRLQVGRVRSRGRHWQCSRGRSEALHALRDSTPAPCLGATPWAE